jgi:hypothetical protein
MAPQNLVDHLSANDELGSIIALSRRAANSKAAPLPSRSKSPLDPADARARARRIDGHRITSSMRAYQEHAAPARPTRSR